MITKSDFMKITIVLTTLLLCACAMQTNGENLNVITSQQTLTRKAIEEKYDLVKPIKEDQMIGKWKLIASFMTVEMSDGSRGNTILMDDELLYDFRTNGVYHIDNEIDHDWKWELTKNNTTFFDWGYEIDPENEIEDYDQWKIRIGNDTMEWILKVDEEYAYQVLVKQ